MEMTVEQVQMITETHTRVQIIMEQLDQGRQNFDRINQRFLENDQKHAHTLATISTFLQQRETLKGENATEHALLKQMLDIRIANAHKTTWVQKAQGFMAIGGIASWILVGFIWLIKHA